MLYHSLRLRGGKYKTLANESFIPSSGKPTAPGLPRTLTERKGDWQFVIVYVDLAKKWIRKREKAGEAVYDSNV